MAAAVGHRTATLWPPFQEMSWPGCRLVLLSHSWCNLSNFTDVELVSLVAKDNTPTGVREGPHSSGVKTFDQVSRINVPCPLRCWWDRIGGCGDSGRGDPVSHGRITTLVY